MRGLLRIIIVLMSLTWVGVFWFRFVSGWSWIDSLYMTVITLSTVGYLEVHPLTDADKIFICVYLSVGLGVFLYGVVEIGESIVRSELGQWWRQRNMSQTMKNLKDHFVVCGGGRMGVLLCEDLADRGIQFVIIDANQSVVDACHERQWHAICADATEDETLAEAGVDRCAGIATTLGSDADNLYVVISARLLNADVQIVARAHDDRSAKKLVRGGANRVVSPYGSGAAKMGQLLTNPRLNEFVEIISDRNVAFDIVGLPVSKESPFAGKNLNQTELRQRGVMIIAVRHRDGSVELAPSGDLKISAGDELFALGDTKAVGNLSKNDS